MGNRCWTPVLKYKGKMKTKIAIPLVAMSADHPGLGHYSFRLNLRARGADATACVSFPGDSKEYDALRRSKDIMACTASLVIEFDEETPESIRTAVMAEVDAMLRKRGL